MEKGLQFDAYVEKVLPSMAHPGESVLQLEDGAKRTIPLNPLNKQTNLLQDKRVHISTDTSGKITELLLLNPWIADHRKLIYPVSPQERDRIGLLLQNDENIQMMYAARKRKSNDYLAVFDSHIPPATEKFTIQQMAEIDFACIIMDIIYENKYVSDYLIERKEWTIPRDDLTEELLVSSYTKYMEIAQYTVLPHTFEEFLMQIEML